MAHTHTSCLIHTTFSTKGRAKSIVPGIQPELWAYMGGIARENKFTALATGGTDDHAHLLISLPATLPLAKAVQLIKGGSSKWLHENFPQARDFAWQEG